MTESNVIPFPDHETNCAAERIARVTELAQHIELLASGLHDALDFPGLLNLVEQSSQTLAELGRLLLLNQDREQMESVLASLRLLIGRARDRIDRLNDISRCRD